MTKKVLRDNCLIKLSVAVLLFASVCFPLLQASASPVVATSTVNVSRAPSGTPACTKKVLWYTKGSKICAPRIIRGKYEWQTSLKKADTIQFMKTCRSYFSTLAGQMVCDWMQKYVNNLLTMKGPKDNCLNFWKDTLNNAVLLGTSNRNLTVGEILVPYTNKHSWICHPS